MKTSIAIISIAVICVALWCNNIIKLAQCDFEPPYKAEVIRIAGVFAPPIGVILGAIEIDDKGQQQ